MSKFSRILGTGSYLPQKILTNADLEKIVDTSDEWIRERTGISARHVAAADESTSTMATIAARQAIEAAQISPQQIELILVATCTGDCLFPSTACLVQKALGLDHIPAFDISAACAGFCYALSTADQFIRAGQFKHVLVIGSEVMSRMIDWTDRSTCVLFGDGAGAVVLGASDKPGIHSTHLHASGQADHILFMSNERTAPGLRTPASQIHMQGQDVFRFAVNALADVIDETLLANNIDKEQIDWLIPHQANVRIIQAMARKLNLSMDRVILTIQDQGNTSGASVPLALDYAIRSSKVQRGDRLLLEAIGSGMVWGSAYITYF